MDETPHNNLDTQSYGVVKMARKSRKTRGDKEERRSKRKNRSVKEKGHKPGVYKVQVFNDGIEIVGKVVSSDKDFVTVQYKHPRSAHILQKLIPAEHVVAVTTNSVVIRGRVLVDTLFATRVARKENKIGVLTVEGDKLFIYGNDVDITMMVKAKEEEKEAAEDDDEDDEDDSKSKKKKKKKDDDDFDEDDDDEKPKKKKKKKDDDEEDEDEDENSSDEDEDVWNPSDFT